MRRTLRPFGATVVVSAGDPRVFEALAMAVARFPDVGATGSFSIDVHVHPDADADPAWPVTTARQYELGLTYRCGSAVLQVDHRAGAAKISVPASIAAIPDALRSFVEGAVSSLLIGAGVLHAVHSGLVQTAGRGMLIRGPSGAGKSTLTYACMAAGFHIVSDDWVYGIAGRPPDRLVGYPWRIFLVPDVVRHFPELAGTGAVTHPGSDRWKLPVQPPVHQRRTTASVDAIVLLDPASELDVRRVDGEEAARRFWAAALPSEQATLPADWVDALLDRPCFVVQRGTSPAATAAALHDLARSLR